MYLSLYIIAKACGSLLNNLMHDLIILLAELIEVVFLKLRPGAVFVNFFLLFFGHLVQFRRHFTLEDKLFHLLSVLLAHVLGVGWILCF